jgi:hypothetical protein
MIADFNTTIAVASRLHLQHIQQSQNCLSADTIATGDYAIINSSQSGTPAVNVWDCVGADLPVKNDAKAWQIVRYLAHRFSKDESSHTISLGALGSYDLFYALRCLLNSYDSFRCLIHDRKIGHIIVYGDVGSWFLGLPNPAPVSMFNMGVVCACIECDLPFSIIPLQQQGDSHRIVRGPEVQRPAGVKQEQRLSRKSAGLILQEHIGRSEQYGFIRHLEGSACRNDWLIVSDVPEHGSELPSLSRATVLSLPFDEIEEERLRLIETLLSRYLAECDFLPWFNEFNAQVSGHNLLRSFSQHCRHIYRQYLWAGFLMDATLCPVLVHGYDVTGMGRARTAAALKRGVQPIAVDHACLSPISSAKLNSDTKGSVAVWGAYDVHVQRQYRPKSAHVYCVGTLRGDMKPKRVNVHSGKQIGVFTTNPTSGDSMTLESWPRLYRENWAALIDYCDHHISQPWYVKLHPRYDMAEHYHELFAQCINKPSIISDSIGFSLEKTSVALLFNCYSTVVVQLVMAGIPVVILNQAMLVQKHEFYNHESMRAFGNIDACLLEISKILQCDVYRESVLTEQKSHLDAYVVASGVESGHLLSDRIVESLAEDKYRDTVAIAFNPSRWLLDLLVWIESVLSGRCGWWSAGGGMCVQRMLSRKSGILKQGDISGICMNQLGGSILSSITWWPKSSLAVGFIRHSALLLTVYMMLPSRIRPAPRLVVCRLLDIFKRSFGLG